MVPVYSVTNFLAVHEYQHAIYFQLAGNAYAALALAAFFNLLNAYFDVDLHGQKEYFRSLSPKPWKWPISWMQMCTGGKSGILRTPRSGLTWFNVILPTYKST